MHDDVEVRADADLVRAVSARSERALAEVHRRYGGAVRALARRVTGADDLAEDVSQTVFIRLWDQPDRFDPSRGSLRSWLLAQAHGRAVDLVRSELARRRRHEREARHAVAPAGGPEAEAHAASMAADVRRALSGLPAGERAAIELAYFGGRTYREAAALLGEPEGTVKSRIRSGLRHLQQALESKGITG